jgi:hypothetical protein
VIDGLDLAEQSSALHGLLPDVRLHQARADARAAIQLDRTVQLVELCEQGVMAATRLAGRRQRSRNRCDLGARAAPRS